MDIFSIINLLGGLALFLYGMSVMSQGLEKLAGGKLEGILRSMTSNKFKSLLLGLGVTAIIQSSSAVTVMLVGLVNSSIMTLEQSVGVIMGTNIGTTVTAWLLSLVGISSNNIFLKLLKPEAFSPIIALIGVLMMMASKSDKRKDAGSVMLGFAVLMYGMNFMSSSMEPLKDMPEFAKVLTAFNNPVFGILAGILVTAVIQSSSASVGILQALSMTSGLTYGMVIPIIMGQNIGTCVTSVISSIGVSKNAKRVAVVHIAFNIIGTIIFMVAFSIGHYLINFGFINKAVTPVDIAIIHSLFNIFTTVIIFPFAEKLVPISHKFVGGEEDDEMEVFLDKRLLFTPSIAVEEARAKTNEMVEIAFQNFRDAITLSNGYSDELFEKIKSDEKLLDYYEDQLGSFNVSLAKVELSERDSANVSMMLHSITDAERIGDHSLNIAESIYELHDKGLSFSGEARRELDILSAAVSEILTLAGKAILEMDAKTALRVEPLEELIDDIVEHIKANHIARLKNGVCTIELGFILNDILADIERVSDHCSNIAAAEIELKRNNLHMHQFVKNFKDKDNVEFTELYDEFSRKYSI
ncbi:Na/Pi cotransporter family protein [Mogibacterium diversum]|uniref:Na/Pi cotransporter family protein n=1 Tax=Mogibacterium diversum TaxID=114527 RepID=UPI0028E63CDE|nr:Na/Pi cotransporter family protein [Mogibacterium diversum]